MFEYLGLIILFVVVMCVKMFTLKYRIEKEQYFYIKPEIFAEKWLEEAENGDENSLYYKMVNNQDEMCKVIGYNLKTVKTLLNNKD